MVLRSATTPFTPDLDALVHEQLDKWKVPGLAIAIVHGSSTYSKAGQVPLNTRVRPLTVTQAYGFAEFPSRKMTPDALFCACSTTKAFTAAAVSLAIDKSQNKLSWSTPLASIIRNDFVLADEYATSNTTLEDALSHRSGLPGHEVAMMIADPNESLRHEVRKLRYLPLAYSPRAGFKYCNHMYMAVTHALETISDQKLGSILKKQIWQPLDMKHTYYDITEAIQSPSARAKLVTGYTYVPELKAYIAEGPLDYTPTTGAGSMVSNVLDYAKWIRSWIYRSGPLSSPGYDALLAPRSILTNTENGIVAPDAPYHLYALGWFIDQVHGERLYWHSGSWPGYGIMVGFVPELKWGFAMMGNTVNARKAEMEIYLYLIGKLVGASPPSSGLHSFKEQKRAEQESLDDAKKRLYPCLPEPPIPHSLPLCEYAGKYTHPGYGDFELVVESGTLRADLMDRVERQKLAFQHASGEFWFCVLYSPTKGMGLSEKFKAEFYVDEDGIATRVGIELEAALRGEKIWFERVGGVS